MLNPTAENWFYSNYTQTSCVNRDHYMSNWMRHIFFILVILSYYVNKINIFSENISNSLFCGNYEQINCSYITTNRLLFFRPHSLFFNKSHRKNKHILIYGPLDFGNPLISGKPYSLEEQKRIAIHRVRTPPRPPASIHIIDNIFVAARRARTSRSG